MIIAQAAKIQLEEIVVEKGSDLEKDLQKKASNERFSLPILPMLETDDGDILTQTSAIVQFLAASGAPQLLGNNAAEMAQVDQWMSFIRTKTMMLAQTLSCAVFGLVELDDKEHAHINNEMRENVKILNKQLEKKDWLCGTENATIADYQLAVASIELHQCVLDTNTLKSLNNLSKHFKKVAQLPEFKGRMGNIKQGKRQLLPKFAGEDDKADKAFNPKS